jgi:CHAT domain-containing protein/tetratricopeptide (TPR) repeat protein
LAGQTAYAPYPTPLPRRGDQIRRIEQIAQRSAVPPRDRILYLLSNESLGPAVAVLEHAVQKTPGDVMLLSDLSAVYGERARREDRPDDYAAALEMAERAAAAAPDAVEPVFNRAIALEHLFLDEEARRAWQHYLEIESSPLWEEEARAHLARLTAATSRRSISSTEENAAAAQMSIARKLESLGRPAEAWKYRYQTLSWAHTRRWMPQASQVVAVLDSAVIASLKQKRPAVALDFQSELITLAEISGRQGDSVLGLLRRSRIEAVLGRTEKARRDFEQALADLHGAPAWRRKEIAAAVDVARAEIAATEERAAAIATDFQSTETWAPELLNANADFDFRLGDTAAAESHLESALDELDRRRAKVVPGTYRISYRDQAQPIFERMIALQLHLGRPENGLEVLERFRARTLLDQLQNISARDGGTAAAPLSWREICHRIPENTLVVVYDVVENRLVTWLVRSERVAISPRQPSWDAISTLVPRLGEAQSRPAALKDLGRNLLEPWRHEIHAKDRIVFVPTLSLYSVPFAALIDPSSGRFLIQDHAVGVAPSASEFVAAVERDRTLSATPLASVLLVGNPTRNERSAYQLPPLPGSAWEIDLLSDVYRGLDTRVLTLSEATPAHVLSFLGQSDIVHLSAHSLADHEDPARSHLVLASKEGASGDLSARDILRLRLPRTRLVVMAACGTQAGPVSASEGALSLSSAFLAAGVPSVVGSLWLVDDTSTARLSVRFHQELRRGVDALSALRTAQLEEIERSPGHTDWNWASFQLFGGVAAREPLSR